jgi:tetratricopeptide (TPR) repeat protein
VKAFEGKNPDSLSENDLVKYGQALKRMGLFDKAADMLVRAFHRDSTRCDVPYDLGSLYLFRLKRYSDAVNMFDKKIACDTAAGYQFASHLNSAMAYMQLKKFREAKSHVLACLGFKSDNVQAWQTLAQVNGQLDDIDSEIVAYKKVIELAMAAEANGEEGKYAKQQGEATKMIGIRYLIAATKDKEQKSNKPKYQLAFDWLKKALPFYPKDCELLLYTGEAAQNSNLKDDAKKYYCKVIDACPKSKQADDAGKYLTALGVKCGE